MTMMIVDDPRVTASKKCLPGDVLILGTLGGGRPSVYKEKFSNLLDQRFFVEHGRRALVIYRVDGVIESWVLVLCEGRIGWVDWVSIIRLEAAS